MCRPTTLRPGSTDSRLVLAVSAQRPCIFVGLSPPHQDQGDAYNAAGSASFTRMPDQGFPQPPAPLCQEQAQYRHTPRSFHRLRPSRAPPRGFTQPGAKPTRSAQPRRTARVFAASSTVRLLGSTFVVNGGCTSHVGLVKRMNEIAISTEAVRLMISSPSRDARYSEFAFPLRSAG